jgi:hypothetical protein
MSNPGGPIDWNFTEGNVQDNLNPRDFISSESVVLCYIPTGDGNDSDVTKWKPIGLIESLAIQQRKQVQELFEIGSKQQYFIPGRTLRRITLNRILFDGGSLLKVLNEDRDPDSYGEEDSPAGAATSNFYINLASGFFDKTLDLGLVIHDQENEAYGAVALKECYVESHSLAFQAQATVVMENVSLTCRKLIPANYQKNSE